MIQACDGEPTWCDVEGLAEPSSILASSRRKIEEGDEETDEKSMSREVRPTAFDLNDSSASCHCGLGDNALFAMLALKTRFAGWIQWVDLKSFVHLLCVCRGAVVLHSYVKSHFPLPDQKFVSVLDSLLSEPYLTGKLLSGRQHHANMSRSDL